MSWRAAAALCACGALFTLIVSLPRGMLPAAADAAIPASADNWGLAFPEEGKTPVGNATAEDLAQYGAYFLGTPAKRSST